MTKIIEYITSIIASWLKIKQAKTENHSFYYYRSEIKKVEKDIKRIKQEIEDCRGIGDVATISLLLQTLGQKQRHLKELTTHLTAVED